MKNTLPTVVRHTQAGRNGVEVTLKRYRYTGKERDDETGLNYHEARYYAPSLGRWTACDPDGMNDGSNMYTYVGQNPVLFNDSSGRAREPGHYYTVFLLSLAAGLSAKDSYLNAFYAQMPDEVLELDAAATKGEEVRTSRGFLSYFDPPDSKLIPYGDVSYTSLIHRRVHGLTGGSSDIVQSTTADALRNTEPATVRFGLLSHRYTDLMHKRFLDERSMYPISPLLEGYGHATVLTSADDINRRPRLYEDIAVGYFTILTELSSRHEKTPIWSENEVRKVAKEISSLESDELQIEALRKHILDILAIKFLPTTTREQRELNYILSYEPEKQVSAVPMVEFILSHQRETIGRSFDFSLWKVYQDVKRLPE